jgi:hypothetical protein
MRTYTPSGLLHAADRPLQNVHVSSEVNIIS